MEKRLMTFLACLFLSLGMALAQIQVNGTVVSSEDGEPVVGASVRVVGTKTGTVTDINGSFSMNVPANSKLEFSLLNTVLSFPPSKSTANSLFVDLYKLAVSDSVDKLSTNN